MKLLYVYRGHNRIKEIKQRVFTENELVDVAGPIQNALNTINSGEFEILSVFVDSIINKQVLDRFPKLKLVCTRSTGFDHIDVEECTKRGIMVANVPGYGSSSVSELALMLMLGVARNLKPSLSATNQGNLERSDQLGFELKNKTLGIIGTGAIGAYLATIAKAIGMNVLLNDRHPNQKLAKKLNAPYVANMNELLTKVDFLSLHIPLTDETRHLISYEELAVIKRGSVIINTARGGIIYSPALLEALDNNHLYGAGLDVLELEQYWYSHQPPKNPEERSINKANLELIHHPKVLHTLHLGAQTEEAENKILDITIENINAFIKDQPINLINNHAN